MYVNRKYRKYDDGTLELVNTSLIKHVEVTYLPSQEVLYSLKTL